MSLIIVASISLGIWFGNYFSFSDLSIQINKATDIILLILLFIVGLDLGRQKTIIELIKNIRWKVILIPITIIISSILGGIFGAILLGYDLGEGAILGGGLGWYSLSSTILLKEGYVELSTLAFISNISRELIAFSFIPYLAKRSNHLEAIAVAGVSSMDTTLPLISSNTDSKTTLIAFISGVICSTSVPIILPIFIKIFL